MRRRIAYNRLTGVEFSWHVLVRIARNLDVKSVVPGHFGDRHPRGCPSTPARKALGDHPGLGLHDTRPFHRPQHGTATTQHSPTQKHMPPHDTQKIPREESLLSQLKMRRRDERGVSEGSEREREDIRDGCVIGTRPPHTAPDVRGRSWGRGLD